MRRCTRTAGTLTAAALALAAALAATAATLPAAAAQARVCDVAYRITAQWATGYTADVRVTNLSGATWSTWDISWQYAAGQRIAQLWNVQGGQSGATVSLTPPPWGQPLRTGQSHGFGLLATSPSGPTPPTTFLVNGAPCGGDQPTPAPSADPSTEPPVGGNPYAGAAGYVDPDWSARAAAEADAAGGELGRAMAEAARQPTAVWLDSIAAVAGLRRHLDAALAQRAAAGRPVVVTLVLYNLPNRSCHREPNGELTVAGGGLARYRTEYVDRIVAALADPAYRSLRVAVVVEPDAMWGVLVGAGRHATAQCAEFAEAGVYLDAIPYALARLHEVPNVSAYLDIAQSNLLGWESNFAAAVAVFREAAVRTPTGVASVDGFAVNVADYDPMDEPFLDIDARVGGTSIVQSRFVDWNDHLEERTYVEAVHAALVAEGFPASAGMLVDTSRNGWGGPARPTAASTSTDVNTFVDDSKVDRRAYRYTWCNQVGAGLGERPRADPAPHVHAYAWIKPPGESDGDAVAEIRCDPAADMPPIGGSFQPTNAMPGAPPRGGWFPAAFTELVRHAHPPLG